MLPNKDDKLRSIHVVMDWDCTLTQHDTVGLLKEIALARDARTGVPTDVEVKWNELVSTYSENHQRFVNLYAAERNAVQTSADFQRYIELFAPLEASSIENVYTSAVFRGVQKEDIEIAAAKVVTSGQLQLRKGWLRLLSTLAEQPNIEAVSILSVNWSAYFIFCCLEQYLKRHCLRDEANGACRSIKTLIHSAKFRIVANELMYPPLSKTSTGRIAGGIHTASDKKKRYDELLCDPRSFMVYAGDSVTDYQCLRAANIGIWLHEGDSTQIGPVFSSKFYENCESPRPLSIIDRVRLQSESGVKGLTWASDLDVVADFLLQTCRADSSQAVEST